jgi:FKBP-type peptidyl-prolyl cis-trans isomerase 2
MSRKDAKELGERLDEGQAALIVIGESRVQEQLDKALTRAQKSEERQVDADARELARELDKVPS